MNDNSYDNSYNNNDNDNNDNTNDICIRCKRPRSRWIPFGDHPLKLERYRED